MTGAKDEPWSLKCDVHVHPHREAYNRALNRANDTSVGSTMMNFDEGRAVLRRIDVRTDASDWSNAALPHELTHVVQQGSGAVGAGGAIRRACPAALGR